MTWISRIWDSLRSHRPLQPGRDASPSAGAVPPQRGPAGSAPGGEASRRDEESAHRPETPDLDQEIADLATQANDRGRAAADAGEYAAAEGHYREAARLAPEWAAPHFNLGIAYKQLGRWRECLDAGLRACALTPGSGEACWWNLGIAATALGDWATARRAWRAFGITVPDGEGPLDMRLGGVPIRIAVESAPEVVWCHRLDPARARIANIPQPKTGRRHGDLLLTDGAPVGRRQLGSRQVPVFEELAVLEASSSRTIILAVTAPTPADTAALQDLIEKAGWAWEDWTQSIDRTSITSGLSRRGARRAAVRSPSRRRRIRSRC